MSDKTALTDLLEVAQAAVDRARSLVQQSGGHRGNLTAKGNRDIATEVDFAVEREVRSFLAEATPHIGFLGEEEGAYDDATDGRPIWVLDPIDGTANFAHGLPLCSVSLGLVQDEASPVGVIDLPFFGERYQATAGGGAALNDDPVHTRRSARLSEAIVAIGDYAVGENAGGRNRTRLQLTALLAEWVERVRMLGSAAIDLAWVAAGRLDASVVLANKPWDTAAGVLIAREAGATVCDPERHFAFLQVNGHRRSGRVTSRRGHQLDSGSPSRMRPFNAVSSTNPDQSDRLLILRLSATPTRKASKVGRGRTCLEATRSPEM